MLQTGYYTSSLSPCYIFHFDGNKAKLDNIANVGVIDNDMYLGPCNYGKFGPAAPEVKAKSGKEFYDMEFTFMDGMFKQYAVKGEDGKSFSMMGFYKELETYNWISEEDMIKYRESCEHVSSPSTPFEIKPGKPGKFVWVTGTPGAGKTTSAFNLGKKHGFVYFEADCYFLHTNPYVPLDVESPAGAFFKQPPLKVQKNSLSYPNIILLSKYSFRELTGKGLKPVKKGNNSTMICQCKDLLMKYKPWD